MVRPDGAGRVPGCEHRCGAHHQPAPQGGVRAAAPHDGRAPHLVERRLPQRAHDDGHDDSQRVVRHRLAHALALADDRRRRPLLARDGRLATVPGRALDLGRARGLGAGLHHRHGGTSDHAVAVARGGGAGTDGGRGGRRGRAGRTRAQRGDRGGRRDRRRRRDHRRRTGHRRRLPGLGQHAHGRQRHARGPYEGLEPGRGGGRRAGGPAPPARPLPPRGRHQRGRLAREPTCASRWRAWASTSTSTT